MVRAATGGTPGRNLKRTRPAASYSLATPGSLNYSGPNLVGSVEILDLTSLQIIHRFPLDESYSEGASPFFAPDGKAIVEGRISKAATRSVPADRWLAVASADRADTRNPDCFCLVAVGHWRQGVFCFSFIGHLALQLLAASASACSPPCFCSHA